MVALQKRPAIRAEVMSDPSAMSGVRCSIEPDRSQLLGSSALTLGDAHDALALHGRALNRAEYLKTADLSEPRVAQRPRT